MSDMSDVTCFLCDRPLERVRYFCRQLLTADDMTVEQESSARSCVVTTITCTALAWCAASQSSPRRRDAPMAGARVSRLCGGAARRRDPRSRVRRVRPRDGTAEGGAVRAVPVPAEPAARRGAGAAEGSTSWRATPSAARGPCASIPPAAPATNARASTRAYGTTSASRYCASCPTATSRRRRSRTTGSRK